jgi:hypothetical protein
MSDSLKTLQDMFKAQEAVYKTVKDGTNSAIREFIDVNEAMKRAVNEKDFEKLKKGAMAARDKLEKAGGAVELSLEQWMKAGKTLEKALEAEAKTREDAYKKIWQDSQDIEQLNKKITEVNKTRDAKNQIPLEKPIVVSTDGVADVKNSAATLMFMLQFIEGKQAEIKEWMKDIVSRKKSLAKLKFKPSKGRK